MYTRKSNSLISLISLEFVQPGLSFRKRVINGSQTARFTLPIAYAETAPIYKEKSNTVAAAHCWAAPEQGPEPPNAQASLQTSLVTHNPPSMTAHLLGMFVCDLNRVESSHFPLWSTQLLCPHDLMCWSKKSTSTTEKTNNKTIIIHEEDPVTCFFLILFSIITKRQSFSISGTQLEDCLAGTNQLIVGGLVSRVALVSAVVTSSFLMVLLLWQSRGEAKEAF